MLFDGFSNMVLASAIEPLRVARDLSTGASMAWRLATIDGAPVRSSSGLELYPDYALPKSEPFDALFLVCGYGVRRYAEPAILAKLRNAARKARVVGGLDTGAWIMASAGLLNGYSATIHWQELANFEETFFNVDVRPERFVIDRDRITAGGASTVMNLMLDLIRNEVGDALAFDVSNMFIYDVESNFSLRRGARSQSFTRVPRLEQAITEMRRSAEQPVAIERIAEATAISPRTLDRLFHRELGISPGRYYQMIRLNLARSLAEETELSVTEIAMRTGFASAATLSRAFSQHFGRTIRALRKGRLRFGTA